MKTIPTILSTALLGANLVCTPVAFAVEAAVTDDTYAYTTTNYGATATMVASATGSRRIFLNFALQQAAAAPAPPPPRAQDADGPLPIGFRGEEMTPAGSCKHPK